MTPPHRREGATAVRLLTEDDAADLSRLLTDNREFLAPYEPAREPSHLTVAHQAGLVAHLLTEHGLHRLQAGTLLSNSASQAVLQRNGFERSGVARRYLLIAGRWQDHVPYQRTS